MGKREKRLKKGVGSLEIQEKIHEEKLEDARRSGNKNLERYYIKEMSTFDREKKYKLSKLYRKDKSFKEDKDDTNLENSGDKKC